MPHHKFILVITLLFLIAGCAPIAQQEPAPTKTPPADLEQYFESQHFVQGVVQPGRTADLSFSISGQTEDIHVMTGDKVTKGDVLTSLITDKLEQRVRAAEAELAVAEANQARVLAGTHPSLITEAESRLAAIEVNPALTIPAAQVKEAEINAAQARVNYLKDQPRSEEIEIAAAEVEMAKIAVDAAKLDLESANLKAPYNGRIIAIYKQSYEHLEDGEPVIQIGDENTTAVFVNMNDIEIADLSLGTSLDIQFPALPETQFSGTITSIQPQWDEPRENRFTVMITLDENDDEIRWGMTANVILP